MYEQSDRIGGKSRTIQREGVPHEMGTCYLHPLYTQVKALLAAYDAEEVKPGGRDGTRNLYDERLTGDARRALDLGAWMLGIIEQATLPRWLWWAPDRLQVATLLLAVHRYGQLHEALLGPPVSGLPPEPSPDAWDELALPFATWLEKHKLEALQPLLALSNSAQGYGLLQIIPTFYGLHWATPALMQAFLDSGRDPDRPVLTMLKDGYQPLWERIVAKDGLDVRFNTRIEAVRRDPRVVALRGQQGGAPFTAEADWVALCCDLRIAGGFLDASPREQAIFGALHHSLLTTTLFESAPTAEAGCITYWPARLHPDQPGALYCTRASQRCVRPEAPPAAREAHVAYQYLEEPRPDAPAALRAQLDDALAAAGFTDVTVHEQFVWPYFPRFRAEGLRAGYPWRLLEMQGENRTWYAGSSCIFESVHDVVNYNHALLDRVLGPQNETDSSH